ncbi:MAG: late competence development ComFB family protein [Tissierellia bacterium]|nr:late competence development ComFB family protein [Tissierellia bacterium]
MQVHNLMEDLVLEVFDKTLEGIPDVCNCSNRRNDMLAIILNNLKPKYVATDRGYVFSRAETLSYQFNTDITKLITYAADIVKNNPRHE